MIAVLVPTLERPENVQRVADDLFDTVTRDDAELFFIVEAHDVDTIAAINAAKCGLIINERAASYAGAINTAVEQTAHPHLLIAADDLHFHPGWLPPLLERSRDFGFVGTNDMHNPDVLSGEHATHYLVSRNYVNLRTVDGDHPLLHEGYVHNYTDTEAVATAKFRGEYTPCMDSLVEHLHWCWGLAPLDETYNKGARTVNADQALFQSRSHLWT
jgi:hypothetical protein